MTLKQLIASKAEELVQLLEHCDDGDFVDRVLMAVNDCDTLALWSMQEEK